MQMTLRMRALVLIVLIVLIGGAGLEPTVCAKGERSAEISTCQSPAFPHWTFDPSHVFPKDRSLSRPEDGKALPDGRIVVADERYGLLLIDKDGSQRPFGHLDKAGYTHNPPNFPGGSNGVFLEHDASHLIMADVYSGKIFRVNIHTEDTRLIFDHVFGVNSVYRDRKGTLWFTPIDQQF